MAKRRAAKKSPVRKKTTRPKRQPAILTTVRSIDRFVDASRRFFIVAERWNNGFVNVPIDGVDWSEVRKFERIELQVSLRFLRGSVDRLMKDCENIPTTLPAQWQTVIRSAANLADHACNDAAERGWFDGQHGVVAGSAVVTALRKSVQLLTFVSDVMTVQGMPDSVREILQAVLEKGPTKAEELAKLCHNADHTGTSFRKTLAGLVDDDLLLSGKGRSSTGYRLSERGMQLAQLCGQLGYF